MAIDSNVYNVLSDGFTDKSEAYEHIRRYLSHLKGITTYFDDGKWYIVEASYLK